VTDAWWRRTTVYQIYPRSFADANGDGIGDLRGIRERLDYLQWLGVETLWLSPFTASPQRDFGYDISDHLAIAPEYGTLDDCRALIDAIHARGMKVVLDMVLNHTSDQHPWFVESRAARDGPRRDFYLWRDGRGRRPPNNWRSMLGGSGWHRDAATGQWYWASFLPFQPDLNWRNPEVKRAMFDVVRHWLRAGADGLRLDIFNAIHKDPAFADNPWSPRPLPSEDDPAGFFQRPLHTQNHPDTFAFARELRAVVDEFDGRFLVGEVFGPPALLRRYCGDGLHLVFLFRCMRAPFTAAGFRALVAELEAEFPEPLLPTYVFANHDRPRAIARLGNDPARARLLAAFQLTVRGVPFIYYGDELGLPDDDGMPFASARDPLAARYRWVPASLLPLVRRLGILLNRDECRSPMPWDASSWPGEPWLRRHPRGVEINVTAQRDDAGSVLRAYRRMLALRRATPELAGGNLTLVPPPGDPRRLLAYRRGDDVLVVLNFSSRATAVKLPRGRAWSNLDDEPFAPPRALRPWEGVVIVT
jgi:glycosidase